MRNQTTKIPFWVSLVSSSLMLFFWGLFLFLAVSFHILAESALENIRLKIILSDYIAEKDVTELVNYVKQQPYAKSVKYISKTEALKNFEATGDRFMEAMDGVNPLPAIIEVQLYSEYIDATQIKNISNPILERKSISEIYYPVREISDLLGNMERIRWIGLGICVVLTIVTALIIINTVKLAIYSKRLTIRTMQLIGATKPFIRRPFVRLGLLQGLVAGVVATVLIGGLLATAVATDFLNLDIIIYSPEVQIMSGFLIIFGALIGYTSSHIAVNRFLDKNLDSLYE